MALDAAALVLCASELKGALADARVDKISQPTRDEVLLNMRTREGHLRLLLSARNGSARVCLTTGSYENPAVPPSFTMLLRKHIGGGRLLDVRTVPRDRIVFFDFLCVNEMGDLVRNTIAAELMGRYCNLVLVAAGDDGRAESGRVIDALKRVGYDDSEVRQLLPGLAYTLPLQPQNLDFLQTPFGQIAVQLKEQDKPVSDALRKVCGGVGPVVLREICFRAFGPQDKLASQLDGEELAALQTQVEAMRGEWRAGGVPCLVKKPDGVPTEFSFTRLSQYSPQCSLQAYETYSLMLEAYYAEKDRGERLRQKSKQMRKTLQSLYERAQRKQATRTEELAESERNDEKRILGELLTANLYAFNKGDAQVTLLNWYTDEVQSIPLDVRLGPSANAQKYFKEYKKKQTAVRILHTLLAAGAKEIEYLQTVLYEMDAAESENEIEEIRAELKSQGYLKHYKQRDKRQKPADVLRYRSGDGFAILVGRNNAQNEKLTLKTARGKDMWFHIKTAPGSHVVVVSGGKDIPLATQNEAAMLAVWHSSLRGSAQVPVDYTEVKHIRKTGDLPLGMVLYDHYETAYITPSEEAVAKIAKEL